jgi:hypothetical protein
MHPTYLSKQTVPQVKVQTYRIQKIPKKNNSYRNISQEQNTMQDTCNLYNYTINNP